MLQESRDSDETVCYQTPLSGLNKLLIASYSGLSRGWIFRVFIDIATRANENAFRIPEQDRLKILDHSICHISHLHPDKRRTI